MLPEPPHNDSSMLAAERATSNRKSGGPLYSFGILGRIVRHSANEAHLPVDKLARLRAMVSDWLDKHNATKHRILSLS